MAEEAKAPPEPLGYALPQPAVTASKVLLGTAAAMLFLLALPAYFVAFTILAGLLGESTVPTRDRAGYWFGFCIFLGIGAAASFPAVRGIMRWARRRRTT